MGKTATQIAPCLSEATHRIMLVGPIPSKKNRLCPRAGGKGLFQRDEQAGAIDALMWQVREQWGGNEPLVKPRITATFYVLDGRSDMDNKWVTISDVLVKAGVLKNDSIKQLPGPITLEARMSLSERVEIYLEVKPEVSNG